MSEYTFDFETGPFHWKGERYQEWKNGEKLITLVRRNDETAEIHRSNQFFALLTAGGDSIIDIGGLERKYSEGYSKRWVYRNHPAHENPYSPETIRNRWSRQVDIEKKSILGIGFDVLYASEMYEMYRDKETMIRKCVDGAIQFYIELQHPAVHALYTNEEGPNVTSFTKKYFEALGKEYYALALVDMCGLYPRVMHTEIDEIIQGAFWGALRKRGYPPKEVVRLQQKEIGELGKDIAKVI